MLDSWNKLEKSGKFVRYGNSEALITDQMAGNFRAIGWQHFLKKFHVLWWFLLLTC